MKAIEINQTFLGKYTHYEKGEALGVFCTVGNVCEGHEPKFMMHHTDLWGVESQFKAIFNELPMNLTNCR